MATNRAGKLCIRPFPLNLFAQLHGSYVIGLPLEVMAIASGNTFGSTSVPPIGELKYI